MTVARALADTLIYVACFTPRLVKTMSLLALGRLHVFGNEPDWFVRDVAGSKKNADEFVKRYIDAAREELALRLRRGSTDGQ